VLNEAEYSAECLAWRKDNEQPLCAYLGFFESHRPDEYAASLAMKRPMSLPRIMYRISNQPPVFRSLQSRSSPATRQDWPGRWIASFIPCRRHELELYDRVKVPNERSNSAEGEDLLVVQHDILSHVHNWMVGTRDPILRGPNTTPKYMNSIHAFHRRIGTTEHEALKEEAR
jgi:hypothetical protein